MKMALYLSWQAQALRARNGLSRGWRAVLCTR